MSTLTEALAAALNSKKPGQARVFTPGGDQTSLGDRIRAASAVMSSGPHPADIDEARSIRAQIDIAYRDIDAASRELKLARQHYARLMLEKQDIDSVIAESVIAASPGLPERESPFGPDHPFYPTAKRGNPAD